MKIINYAFASLLIILLIPTESFAQNDTKSQPYTIHTDPVYPSKVNEYEAVTKNLVAECKKHNTKLGWATLVTSDFKYIYISPVRNMAELDENGFDDLQEKMGKEAFNSMFEKFKLYYDRHTDHMLTLDKELSYMPEGITVTPEGKNYRNNTLFYYAPKDYDKAIQIAKDFKKLYSDKKSTQYYRVYQSGYGADGNYILVAEASENPESFFKGETANNMLLGDEASAIYKRLLDILIKTETITGYMRPDLSYSPTN